MLRFPELGIPYHMKACDYSQQEVTDRTKQQRVRWLWHQLKPAPPQPSIEPAVAQEPITAEVATRTAPPVAAQSAIQPRDLFTELTNSTKTINSKKTRKTSSARLLLQSPSPTPRNALSCSREQTNRATDFISLVVTILPRMMYFWEQHLPRNRRRRPSS
jgi:hypothetical protein